jgi:hypothetical protein
MPVRVKKKVRIFAGIGVLIVIAALLALYGYPWFRGIPNKEIVETGPAKESVRLFFSSGRQMLVSRSIEFHSNIQDKARAEAVVEELKKEKSIPEKTKLLDLAFGEEMILYVNLSKGFLEGQAASANEVTTIYSLVNSLASAFKEARKVQLLVEGQPFYTVNGVVYTYRPLEFNKDLVEE